MYCANGQAMRSLSKLLLIALLIASSAIWISGSQPIRPVSGSNGCGPWGLGWLVPEFWFQRACEQHDLCYASKFISHQQCTADFLNNMLVICDEQTAFIRSTCWTIAHIYYHVVKVVE